MRIGLECEIRNYNLEKYIKENKTKYSCKNGDIIPNVKIPFGKVVIEGRDALSNSGYIEAVSNVLDNSGQLLDFLIAVNELCTCENKSLEKYYLKKKPIVRSQVNIQNNMDVIFNSSLMQQVFENKKVKEIIKNALGEKVKVASTYLYYWVYKIQMLKQTQNTISDAIMERILDNESAIQKEQEYANCMGGKESKAKAMFTVLLKTPEVEILQYLNSPKSKNQSPSLLDGLKNQMGKICDYMLYIDGGSESRCEKINQLYEHSIKNIDAVKSGSNNFYYDEPRIGAVKFCDTVNNGNVIIEIRKNIHNVYDFKSEIDERAIDKNKIKKSFCDKFFEIAKDMENMDT